MTDERLEQLIHHLHQPNVDDFFAGWANYIVRNDELLRALEELKQYRATRR